MTARETYDAAGFRCCSFEDFQYWWESAKHVPNGGHPANASAVVFCHDCMRVAQEEMIGQGRCVKWDHEQEYVQIQAARAQGRSFRDIARSFSVSIGKVQDAVAAYANPLASNH